MSVRMDRFSTFTGRNAAIIRVSFRFFIQIHPKSNFRYFQGLVTSPLAQLEQTESTPIQRKHVVDFSNAWEVSC